MSKALFIFSFLTLIGSSSINNFVVASGGGVGIPCTPEDESNDIRTITAAEDDWETPSTVA